MYKDIKVFSQYVSSEKWSSMYREYLIEVVIDDKKVISDVYETLANDRKALTVCEEDLLSKVNVYTENSLKRFGIEADVTIIFNGDIATVDHDDFKEFVFKKVCGPYYQQISPTNN